MAITRVFSLVGAALLSAGSLPATDLPTLRSQLALATEDRDTLARIELLRRIVDTDPGDVASHRLLTELWLKIRDYDLAEATLQSWPAAPADLAALGRAAILRERDKDIPGAVRILRAYLANNPRNPRANEALVGALLATDDASAQLAALNDLIALAPKNSTSRIQRANVKFRLADYPGALADAKAAQALEPAADLVKESLPGFERLEETLQMLPPLDAALTKNPRDFAKFVERAWWLRYGGILDRSLADADAALALAPASLAAKINRVRALYLLGKIKADDVLHTDFIDASKANALDASLAIAAADLALARIPGDAASLRQRAHALNEAEQFHLARRDGEAALDLRASSKEAAAAGLEALYATAMLGEDPAPMFRRIQTLNPPPAQLALANAHLANFYFRRSDLPLALDFADRSLALEETEFMLRVKAATLKRLGRAGEAEEIIRRADRLSKKSKK